MSGKRLHSLNQAWLQSQSINNTGVTMMVWDWEGSFKYNDLKYNDIHYPALKFDNGGINLALAMSSLLRMNHRRCLFIQYPIKWQIPIIYTLHCTTGL